MNKAHLLKKHPISRVVRTWTVAASILMVSFNTSQPHLYCSWCLCNSAPHLSRQKCEACTLSSVKLPKDVYVCICVCGVHFQWDTPDPIIQNFSIFVTIQGLHFIPINFFAFLFSFAMRKL